MTNFAKNTTITNNLFRAVMSMGGWVLQVFYNNVLIDFDNICSKRINAVNELLEVIPFENGIMLQVVDVFGTIRYLVVVRSIYKDYDNNNKENFVVLPVRDIVGGHNSSYFVSKVKDKVVISILGGRDDNGVPLNSSYKVYVGENGVYVERLKPTNTVWGKITQNKKNKRMYISDPHTYNVSTKTWEETNQVLVYDINDMRFSGIRE